MSASWLALLKEIAGPSDRAVLELAERECDPSRYDEFQPISWGFAGNLIALALVASLGVLLGVLTGSLQALLGRRERGSRGTDG